MDRWDEVEQLLIAEAEHDLEAGEEMVRPCLVAFRGEDPCFVAFLRDFAKGEYADPIMELLALAGPLDADRLAFAITARAWSLDDPVPPVSEDGDLRQRILLIERSDGSDGTCRSSSILLPFDEPVPGQPVRWGERQEMEGAEGWVARVLGLAVGPRRRELQTTEGRIAAQAARVDLLGHLVLFPPEVHARLAAAKVSEAEAREAGLPWPLGDAASGTRRARRHGMPPGPPPRRHPDRPRGAAAPRARTRPRRGGARRRR